MMGDAKARNLSAAYHCVCLVRWTHMYIYINIYRFVILRVPRTKFWAVQLAGD